MCRKDMGPSQAVFALRFATPLGWCDLVYSQKGLRFLALPTHSDFERDFSIPQRSDPPAFVRQTVWRVQAHLGGNVQRYEDIPVDLDGLSDFTIRVLTMLRHIPPGKTVTYGEIAQALGKPNAARAVGQALARNPVPLVIPCHRVVGTSGYMGGFSAPGGLETKRWLLRLEGVVLTRLQA